MLKLVGYSSGDFKSPDEFAEIVRKPTKFLVFLQSKNQNLPSLPRALGAMTEDFGFLGFEVIKKFAIKSFSEQFIIHNSQ